MVSQNISSQWKAHPTNDELRREFLEADFDDSKWFDVQVPGHWSQRKELQGRSSVLYRTPFSHIPDENTRNWLVFDGVWDSADVWLDTDYLGPISNWFLPTEFEVTNQMRPETKKTDHTLCVEVMNPARNPQMPSRSMHGIFNDRDIVGHKRRGGIWKPVRLVTTGPVHLSKTRAVCINANTEQAVILIRTHVLSETERDVTITSTLRPPSGQTPLSVSKTQHVASGATVLEWELTLSKPELWWPWTLGPQPMYKLDVSVVANELISDLWQTNIGLREIEVDDWKFSVNGQRLFCKGVDMWPSKESMGEASDELIKADVQLAKDLGLDLIRVESHVAPKALYDEADRIGMLIWQDFPLRGETKPTVQTAAVEAAHRLVDHLGAHPSIMMWSAHYDPAGTTTGEQATTTIFKRRALFAAARQQLPTFMKSVVDPLIGRAFRKADPSRPVIDGSGKWPSAPRFDGTDSHLRFGWSAGTGRDLNMFARRVPRMVRWVSSLGAQSIPESADVEVEPWPCDLALLADKFGLHEESFAEYLPPEGFSSPTGWINASQEYQAVLLRRQIETLRQLKYHPTGGFTFAALADSRAAISFAIFDHNRVGKRAVEAVRAACAPVIVVADRIPTHITLNDAINLDIHVVNDFREPLRSLRVNAELIWPSGSHQWAWRGSIAKDSVERIGDINWIVPDCTGPVTLRLELIDTLGVNEEPTQRLLASNEYHAQIL